LAIERTFVTINPQYVTVGSEQMVVLSAKEYERLAKKADLWEPPLPAPNERGNYPLEALDVVMAQEISRARRKLGISQAELAKRAGIRVETLNRIEKGKHSPTLRTMQKIDRALKRG
jgi:DNA-binding XRE family transcriptional regulator